MKNFYSKLSLSFIAIVTTLNLSAQSPFYFDPQAVEATLTTNSTITVYSLLRNISEDTVEFSFPGYTLRGAGGPDSFGYSWIDSDQDGGPNFEWVDITETGTRVEGLGDDNMAGPFEMAINFPFYGQQKHVFWISPNGAISFNEQMLAFVNNPIPCNNNYIDFIAWFWDDLMVDSISSVYFQNYDEKTVVQFNKMVRFPGSEAFITGQVIMTVNGGIFIRYKQVTEGFESNSGTVGLQSWNPELGLQVNYNEPYVHSELAVRFDLNRSFITTVSPASGHLPPGSQEHIWVTYSSEGYAAGTYEQELQCVSSLTAVPELFLHNVMHVTNPVMAGFQGYVTDAATGLAINDVKVQVGEHYVYTNGNGHYELPLEQGSYNVQFSREGYQSLTVEDTMAVPGFSILDVQLNGFYFLVGRVFASENPIESGFAYGYKMHEGTVIDIYAEMVGPEGWYEFNGLESAPYIVKAEPSPTSIYYGNYLPTYYGDVLHWEEATVIDLVQNTDGAHIHLVPVINAPEGQGSISGTIDGGRSANIPVVLRATESGIAVMTYSSTDGSFVFSSLDYGTYEVFAEIPGKSITPLSIILDADHQSAEGVDMMILETEIIFLGIAESDIFEAVPFIYPNPVKESINVTLNLKKSSQVNIGITDLAGRIIASENYSVSDQQNLVIDATSLPKGIYLLRCEARGETIVKKFVKD